MTPQARYVQRFIEAVVCILGVVTLCWLLLPEVTNTRTGTRLYQCKNNLKLIGLALRDYHDKWGSFPPAFVADEDGKPIYGWRTLILPHLDGTPIYNAYQFDEPWDGPNNSRFQKDGMPGLVCPCNAQPFRGQTSYVAVVGPNTAWPGSTPAKLDVDFPDGTSKTILVVEFEDSGIHWMEPRDLNFYEMSFTLNDPTRKAISSRHTEKGFWPWSGTGAFVNVLFADGAVKRLSIDTNSETVRALLTSNGGEKVEVPP